jgi:hypothetical protein
LILIGAAFLLLIDVIRSSVTDSARTDFTVINLAEPSVVGWSRHTDLLVLLLGPGNQDNHPGFHERSCLEIEMHKFRICSYHLNFALSPLWRKMMPSALTLAGFRYASGSGDIRGAFTIRASGPEIFKRLYSTSMVSL